MFVSDFPEATNEAAQNQADGAPSYGQLWAFAKISNALVSDSDIAYVDLGEDIDDFLALRYFGKVTNDVFGCGLTNVDPETLTVNDIINMNAGNFWGPFDAGTFFGVNRTNRFRVVPGNYRYFVIYSGTNGGTNIITGTYMLERKQPGPMKFFDQFTGQTP